MGWRKGHAKLVSLGMDSSVLCVLIVGKAVLCGLNNGIMQMWVDGNSGWEMNRKKEVHDKGVKCMSPMQNGVLVTGSYDGHVKVWCQKWQLLAQLNTGGGVMAVVVKELMILAGGEEGMIVCLVLRESSLEKVWDDTGRDGMEESRKMRCIGGDDMVNCLLVAGMLR